MRASSPSTPSAALALPGVVAVYTGADLVAAGVKPLSSQPVFPGPGGAKAPQTPRHALAVGAVRFVGEAVVAVVGTSLDAARAGRDAVVVDYEELPNVVHLDDAVAAGAPKVWADAADNYAAEMRHGNAEACAAAFAQAAHVVALDLVNQRLAPTSLEPRSVLGSYDDGRVTLRMSTPDAQRRARHAVQRGLRLAHRQAARGGRRCRRRLRHEDRRLPGGHRRRLLREHAAAAGEVGVRAQRGIPRRQPRPRHPQPRRAGARCQRPRARPARAHRSQRRRLCHHHRRDHPAADRAVGVDQRLRHPDHRLQAAGGADEHHAAGRLPRRRPARGDLHHRAADGHGRAQAGPGPGRDCAGAT